MAVFDKFIMIAPGSDYGTVMWNDLKEVSNCKYYDYVIKTNNPLIKYLHHAHFSFSLNKFIEIPFQSLWEKRFVLQPYHLDPNKDYCVIFTDISACRVNTGYLKKLSTLSNVTLVLVLVNTVSSKKKLIGRRLKFFSAVFSFDKTDCGKYGFFYHPAFYSIISDIKYDSEKSDAFFVGVSKGKRHAKLVKLNNQLKEVNAVTDFYIAHFKRKEQKDPSIHYNQWLSYRDVLGKVHNTNCIVEITGEEQSGLTLRSMEAICYNKRLLTDNESVKSLKYYALGYILYSPEFNDIDISFITSKEPVDYHYEGDFSPIHLIEHINTIFGSKDSN